MRDENILPAGSRADLLALLRADGPTTVATLSARTGLHANTVREHLQRLVDADLALREPEERTVRGRPRTVYRATADEEPGSAEHLEESVARASLARLLLSGYGTGVDDVAEAARAAGRDAAGQLGVRAAAAPNAETQMAALGRHLARMGFAPTLERPDGPFHLWRCPFLDLARERQEVVCNVHLGLTQGVLERTGGPVHAERLVPFVGPRHCELRLSISKET